MTQYSEEYRAGFAHGRDVGMATARNEPLCAAAPDLLAALKAIAHTTPREDTNFRALCAILIATARVAVEQAEKGEA